MLCIVPGSKCDVCLAPYDGDKKTPCSIECGHVFCEECIHALENPTCPMCRSHLNRETITRLHVQVYNKDPERADVQSEANTFMESISNVANKGSSEEDLQQLIRDCKKFLHSVPRDKFSELRVCYRMVKYLFDYKTEVRGKHQDLKSQLAAGMEYQDRLREKINAYRESVTRLESFLEQEKEQRASALRSVELLSGALQAVKGAGAKPDSSSPDYTISPLPSELALHSLPAYDGEDTASRQNLTDRHHSSPDSTHNMRSQSPAAPAYHSLNRTSSPVRTRNEPHLEHRDASNAPPAYPARNSGQISHASIAAQKYTKQEKRRSSESGERPDEVRAPDWSGGSASSLSSVEQAIISQPSRDQTQRRASLSRNHSYTHGGVLQPAAPVSSIEHGGSLSRSATTKSRTHRPSTNFKGEW